MKTSAKRRGFCGKKGKTAFGSREPSQQENMRYPETSAVSLSADCFLHCPFWRKTAGSAWEGDDTIVIPGGQKYHPQDVCVEGDYSNAVFFDALNLLGGDVVLEGLSEDSLQGDRIYRQYFDRIGREFADIDLTDCPDLGPILMVLAAMRHGARFTGTARLKLKESDRGAAMKEELEKAGARVELADNEIRVQAGVKAPEQILQGHGDHRVVMATTGS